MYVVSFDYHGLASILTHSFFFLLLFFFLKGHDENEIIYAVRFFSCSYQLQINILWVVQMQKQRHVQGK